MMRKLLILLFSLILLFPLVNSAPTSIIDQDFTYWITIALSIIVIHFLIVSLVYMYSNFFSSDDLKVWAKNEIIQGVYSILILASFIGVFTLIISISNGFFAQILEEGITINIVNEDNVVIESEVVELEGFCFNDKTNRWEDSCTISNPSKTDYLKVEVDNGNVVCTGKNSQNCNPLFLMARSYLGISFERLANLHKMLLRNYALMNVMNSNGFGLSVSSNPQNTFRTFGFNVSMGFMTDGLYINILESLILFVEKLLLILKFQESVLKFMEYGLAFFLIILGLMFRSISIFRKLGGLLLSLGICFMFVLPLFYILGWYTLSIPNIQVVVDNSTFEGSDGSSVVESWIFWAVVNSQFSFIATRVIEAISLDKLPGAIAKSVVDTLLMIGQVVMFAEYDMYVNANSPDFYYTKYSQSDNLYQTTYGDMGVFDYISRFLIIGLALPLLNIYMFFAFVRGLSPVLGGDADIPALGRFL